MQSMRPSTSSWRGLPRETQTCLQRWVCGRTSSPPCLKWLTMTCTSASSSPSLSERSASASITARSGLSTSYGGSSCRLLVPLILKSRMERPANRRNSACSCTLCWMCHNCASDRQDHRCTLSSCPDSTFIEGSSKSEAPSFGRATAEGLRCPAGSAGQACSCWRAPQPLPELSTKPPSASCTGHKLQSEFPLADQSCLQLQVELPLAGCACPAISGLQWAAPQLSVAADALCQ
mmetsp:Transcript_147247/g.410182  ORF Transcript_147247/g.410182 Transcript_147247/m.410182 type:complete len:234 (-) Transcript_147247:451-1152(-)